MSKLRLAFVSLALLAPCGVILAQDAPKWSFVEVGNIDFDPDGGSSDDGWYAAGSMRLFKNFHLKAEYDDAGDYTFWKVGGGWHGLLGEPADLFADILWNDVQVDSSTGDESDNGYVVSAGARFKVTQWFEFKTAVNWINLDEGDDTTLEGEALVALFKDHLGFGVNYETGDADTLRLFARLSFGK